MGLYCSDEREDGSELQIKCCISYNLLAMQRVITGKRGGGNKKIT